MIANIKDYMPTGIEFVIPQPVKEKFPLVLFEGSTSIDEIFEIVSKRFNCTFPENETARRKYDKFEIDNIREEYCLKQENDIPKRILELEQAIDNAKRMKKNAEDALESLQTQIRDLAAMVKDGTTDYYLSPVNTIRIALNGHYLYYSWVEGKFQLVKGEKIPEWDVRSLWAQEDMNRQAMKELFGFDFPEVDKPVDAEEQVSEESGDNDDF